MQKDENSAIAVLRSDYRALCTMRQDADDIRAGLWEMAASLLPDRVSAEDVLSLYRLLGGEDLSHPDFAALCARAGKERTIRLPEPEPDDEPEPPPHVLTLRGEGADAAAQALLARSSMTSLYAASAAELCETVADGGARYGILPVYSSTDGVLMHFRRLAEETELKIASLCTVTMRDGASVQYALFQRRRLQLDGGKRFLEIVLSSVGTERLRQLPESLALLGVTVCRSMLLPPTRDGADTRYQIAMDLSGVSLPVLRLYLAGAFPETEAVGYYDLLTTTVS